MDEYLFMTLAKLKADRLRLERERRRAEPEPDPEQLRLGLVETAPAQAHRPSVRSSVLARWFSQQPLWREQS